MYKVLGGWGWTTGAFGVALTIPDLRGHSPNTAAENCQIYNVYRKNGEKRLGRGGEKYEALPRAASVTHRDQAIRSRRGEWAHDPQSQCRHGDYLFTMKVSRSTTFLSVPSMTHLFTHQKSEQRGPLYLDMSQYMETRSLLRES